VRLLSRYLIRHMAAPFVFALVAQTSLMLLSQIAKKFGALVGKGLPWTVIAEVFALSLPFIIAMTLPMAVLLAVLYTFSHLAADNEITAMRASGISVYQILTPVLVWGTLMAGLNYAFVDRVLPETNARLRNLLIDIGRKKPTFELREEVINEIPPSHYFLRASRIDPGTGRLRDVTIYDISSDAVRRVIYADSGLMAYAEGQQDLSLRLYDGAIHQYRPAEPALFQLTYFAVNNIRVKSVFDQLERNTRESIRGDREMNIRQMLIVVRQAETERAELEQQRRTLLERDLTALLTQEKQPLSDWATVVNAADRSEDARRRAARYWVEIHKKWSISAACLSFVIIGVVLALRFPRGGMGLVIGGGMLVFSIHYVGLTAGESLADRGIVTPWVAMWSPNMLLTVLGLIGLLRVSRESGSTRGGDFQEILDSLRHLGRRAVGLGGRPRRTAP
jgi:lipopolysaccharide export system permease protein